MFTFRHLALALLVGIFISLAISNFQETKEAGSFLFGYGLYAMNFFLMSVIGGMVVSRLKASDKPTDGASGLVIVFLALIKLVVLFGCLYYAIVTIELPKIMLGLGALSGLIVTSLMSSRSYLRTAKPQV